MGEITIITAYFNINREDWSKFSRSENQYFMYFCKWAKLKNQIIVYCESEELGKKVLSFRKSIGLEEKTTIHYIKNIENIDEELLASIRYSCENDTQKNFRLFKKNPEVWNAEYDYVMLLKMWCVKDAVERKETDHMVAWVDFGYNHGGKVISEESDFSFVWNYPFEEKINLFTVQSLDDRPIFEIIMSMDTYIMGTVIVGPSALWNDFWILAKQTMLELNRCGLVDDDQSILLMCYRRRPDMFFLYESGWQLVLKQFGGNDLNLIPQEHDSIVKKAYRYMRKTLYEVSLAYRIFNTIHKRKIH